MSYWYWQSNANRQWYWHLVASNGKIIADSAEGYQNEQDCLHGISLVKSSSAAPVYRK